MTTFTDKELIKEIRERIGSLDVRDNIERLAYEIALASLEADPVKRVNSDQMRRVCLEANRHLDKYDAMAKEVNKLLGRIAPPAPIALEAIENAIEYIRSIAFHIDEDDYHGKHIAYFMRQALAWLEGHSCSDDRLGKADNQPVRGNQAAESNRGNEWAGNPDIDNAIIMLDRIDTAESYDDDRIEAVKAVLRRLAGNSPVTPDGWISCSERMPAQDDWILIYSKHGEYMAGQVQGEYVELSDGTLSWLGNVLFWMPLPEPPKGAK
ncbi:TPA: DUF551 domain-containing protein [Escherichia coli]|nr:DUF551 domain-containing protein [Escherichia coli]